MAASDQHYRKQYGLDVVFAVSSILMLVSVLWMFVDDYNREFKAEQRAFRDVETALAQRLAIAQIPPEEEFKEAEDALKEARKKRQDRDTEFQENLAKLKQKMPDKERSEQDYNAVKADLESIKSFYDIEVEHSPDSKLVQRYLGQVKELSDKLTAAQKKKDDATAEVQALRQANDKIEGDVTEALSKLKKVTDKFDTQVKTAIKKQWTLADSIRNMPIVDGFASPIKIHQFTIDDIPIDYNFKYATRFDRCMTCHQGIDRPAYTKSALTMLVDTSDEQKKRLAAARDRLRKRKQSVAGLPEEKTVPDPDDLDLTTVSKSKLTGPRVNEFCAHPRLELFVGSNSKHPAEQFGCTSCHSGQGSATSFTLAAHTPTDVHTEERWKKEHGWSSSHYWDFPMLPQRFIESSCLKCHHEVTDLIGTNNRQEAPKLLRGYYLLREFGCFGCHEISGRKKGREIGPDIRLENYPPLEDLPPSERTKIEADPDTRPGIMRKVGPSLFRISEKTNPEWTAKWLRAPRSFRPDTKMPHFYGLGNNHPDVLPEDQKSFPDAEIQAITYYLFEQSNAYLKKVAEHQNDSLAERKKDRETEEELLLKATLTDAEQKKLDAAQRRIRLRQARPLVNLSPNHEGDAGRGRILFSERGCLACHTHEGTVEPQGAPGAKKPKDLPFAPGVLSEAQFGPNLSQVKAKLGKSLNDKTSARTWLIQWIMDPHVHSPRSRMPVTHLDKEEAADVAAWLLSQEPTDLGADWKKTEVTQPDFKTLQKLSEVYLVRLLSQSNLENLRQKKLPDYVVSDLPKEEQELARDYSEAGLKMYLGRKAIGRLGCFGCHDIPGFEKTKNIGVELNDWGKKDPTRLAFEDIVNFANKNYQIVDQLTDSTVKPIASKSDDGKEKLPYERFFFDLLEHHHREGYLHQKLLDPRSFDYKRLRAWDDRSRMPQFKFARSRKHAGEKEQDYEARALLEEAQAREAVMTFILGLLAEPIPLKSINQPVGDRLAEVKGRQVLDKFNCAGCHLIRPGVFEFKATDDVTKVLEALADRSQGSPDHVFLNHYDWVGRPPGVQLTAHGSDARIVDNEEDPETPLMTMRLVHALRFKTLSGDMKDIRANDLIRFPVKALVYPPPAAAESNDKLHAFLQGHGAFGGTFTDLLVGYLIKKDSEKYPSNQGDSSNARVAGPPILIGQGERTQPEWLYQFLLNPQQIRKMTVLRMPRFNMSQEEAKTIVAYFAAVERMNNPGIGLTFPHETIPQQEDLDSSFWRLRTKEYVERLKSAKAEGKGGSLFDQRVAELTPVWEQILKDSEEARTRAKASHDSAKTAFEDAKKAEDKAKEAFDKEKNEGKKTALLKEYDKAKQASKQAETAEYSWKNELDLLSQRVDKNSLKSQQQTWQEKEAYVVDAFKLAANNQLCMLCHQVGNVQPGSQTQGPPLNLAHERLRPGWTRRWLASPQRFLTYQTIMPTNFQADQPGQYQQWFAGSPLEQLTAVRDLLMAYPRAAALPVNRYWALPMTQTKTSADSKKGDKK